MVFVFGLDNLSFWPKVTFLLLNVPRSTGVGIIPIKKNSLLPKKINIAPTEQWGASGCLGAGTTSEASQVGQSLCCRFEANQIFAYFDTFAFRLLKLL